MLDYNFSKKYDDVVVIKAKYSLKELQDKLNELEERGDFSEIDSTMATIDHQKNTIVVNTNNLNKVEKVISNIGNEYFEVNTTPSETLIKPYLDLFSGIRINEQSSGGVLLKRIFSSQQCF
ncbi:MAG TPA: hypothetical protein VF095_11575 [Bacillota bacterium]